MTEIKIQTLQEGNGETPKSGSTILAHYTGWFAKDEENWATENGAKFDSSYDRGAPLRFNVGIGMVIKGWDQCLLQMSKGQKVRVYIPYQLAYGERGSSGAIPPFADLVFEIELVDILN